MQDIEDNPFYDAGDKIVIDKGIKNKKVIPVDDIDRVPIISASRRTDIPAFYMPVIMKAFEKGYIEGKNRFGHVSKISLDPNDAKCIVWWSKDYCEWLKTYEKNQDLFQKYKHMFNFTITGGDELERGVKSSLHNRLEQITELAQLFGPQCIKFRFDPIVYYTDLKTGEIKNNLGKFELIVKKVAEADIKSCVFAFCQPLKGVVARMKQHDIGFIDLTIEQKHEILDKLIAITDKYDMRLESCCTSEVIGYKNKVFPSKCVDGDIIEGLLKGKLPENKKDKGQRKNCNCAMSKDIGSYEMGCSHMCFYCYSNPVQTIQTTT